MSTGKLDETTPAPAESQAASANTQPPVDTGIKLTPLVSLDLPGVSGGQVCSVDGWCGPDPASEQADKPDSPQNA
jgi:hypothetical protein